MQAQGGEGVCVLGVGLGVGQGFLQGGFGGGLLLDFGSQALQPLPSISGELLAQFSGGRFGEFNAAFEQ